MSETFFVVVRDLDSMTDCQLVVLLMKGSLPDILKTCHEQTWLSGHFDIYKLGAAKIPQNADPFYLRMSRVGLLLEHVGQTGHGSFEDHLRGMEHALLRLPPAQRTHEIDSLITALTSEKEKFSDRLPNMRASDPTPGDEGVEGGPTGSSSV